MGREAGDGERLAHRQFGKEKISLRHMDQPGPHDAPRIHAPTGEGVVVEVLRGAAAARALAVEPDALEQDIAAPGIDEAADGLQQRRLAVSVGAEQPDARAGLHRQRDVAKDLHRLVAAAERAQFQQRSAAHAPPPR